MCSLQKSGSKERNVFTNVKPTKGTTLRMGNVNYSNQCSHFSLLRSEVEANIKATFQFSRLLSVVFMPWIGHKWMWKMTGRHHVKFTNLLTHLIYTVTRDAMFCTGVSG